MDQIPEVRLEEDILQILELYPQVGLNIGRPPLWVRMADDHAVHVNHQGLQRH